MAAAGHDYRPEWQTDDDVIVVKSPTSRDSRPIDEFRRTSIATARRDQELLLTEAERRVFEDALLGRLAQQIHERTTDARDLIAEMNREMRRAADVVRGDGGDRLGTGRRPRPTTAGGQPAARSGRRRLAPDDLATLRAHFAGQIKDLRASRPDRPYAEMLAEALDYRQWRTFVLTLVAPDGQEDRLTQARHSTLSGGEQSVSLHLPLFAAAHVMLSSAARPARGCWRWTRRSPASTTPAAANCSA